ncbi:5-bromo-4-chloroindolyl phosphate hydrolysis family protein [Pararhodobacter sp. SW119]|uniref:5-bromo-4-chloroindolyl phosphate hydrolysis family protein n=1 Tax=Pararhodobacter sp. SW119 TaxID=2780075 RepID=UPI001ADF8573|nr:5-bromo-4-chloroindolyl phosphate hydrolysis family protein [Pararhodobacter sp. SW119]
MARRFGGTYSPGARGGAKAPVAPARRAPVGLRTNLLFVLPFLFAFSAFFRDPAGLLANLGVFALLLLSAWLTREGVIAQDAYDARRVARRPAIPRKIFGAAAMGLGLGLAGLAGGGLVNAVIFAALGAGLHLAAFGADPLRDKGLEGVDQFQTDRVARAVEEAESHLSAMSDAVLRARDRGVEERLAEFQTHVRQLLRAVENDPRRLTAARRYMGVYLLGARDATVKFADLYARERDPKARAAYLSLLDDLRQNFTLRTETLLDSDRQALDIEMEVLRERLEREGLRPVIPDDSTLPEPSSPERTTR